jgi:hypothetical protein
MTQQETAFEFEALVAEGQVISIEVKGMEWENKYRERCGNSPAYCEDSFLIKAEQMKCIADELRKLKD